MVQGLNWNNYSPAQIVEMKNSGIEVPEEVYEKAEAALSEQDAKEVTSNSDDTQSYSIVDSASDKNEAQELRQELEEEGVRLGDMVNLFTAQSQVAIGDVASSMQQIENYVSYIAVEQQQTQELTDAADDAGQVIVDIAADTESKIQAKSDELAFLNDEIEAGTATEEQVAQAEQLGADIKEIADDSSAKIDAKSGEATVASEKAAEADSNLKEIAQNVGKAYNKAIDAQELATETKDMSIQLLQKGNKARFWGSMVGGLFAGEIGAFAGSFIGRKSVKAAQQGLMASTMLNAVSGKTKGTAEQIAAQNNIAITTVDAAKTDIDGASKLAADTKARLNDSEKPQVSTSQDNVEPEDDKDKDKPKA